MLRDIIDRFAYRYRLWFNETEGDKLGAGEAPPELSQRGEPPWKTIVRFLWVIAGGLILLAALYRLAMRTLPRLSDGIPAIFIFLAVIWCSVGLFLMGGELPTRYSRSDNEDGSI